MNENTFSILKQLAESKPEHVHLNRFIAGVVYALKGYDRIAKKVPKDQQLDDNFYSEELKGLLSALEDDSVPLPDNWLRGFYYNAAVMRLDAAWERAFKIILNKRPEDGINGPDLYDEMCESEPILPEYNKSDFEKVRLEVRELKHRKGPDEINREKPEVVKKCLEQLLSLVKKRIVDAT